MTHAFEIPDGLDGQSTGDSESLSQRQFKTAEIADAVLGTELSENTAEIEAFIPKKLISTPCEKEVTEEVKEEDAVIEEAVMEEVVEMKQESPTGGDEQNSTETAKTYKVSCDKRSITGLDTFTVQILNASQVLYTRMRERETLSQKSRELLNFPFSLNCVTMEKVDVKILSENA